MLQVLTKFAETTYTYGSSSSGGLGAGFVVAILLLAVLAIVCMWRVFVKAGRPGWAAIIPIYNNWVFFEIAGKPGWWSLLMLVPLVNIVGAVLYILACIELAKKFGKSGVWGFFLLFLFSFIGLIILAFGDAKYEGGEASAQSAPGGTPFSPAPQGTPPAPTGPTAGPLATPPSPPVAPTPPPAPTPPAAPEPPTAGGDDTAGPTPPTPPANPVV